MLQNYLKTALRNLLKQRFYAVINVLGLAVGIACVLLIALWVQHELSYDQYHSKIDRIYRVHTDLKFGEMQFNAAIMPAPFSKTVVKDLPEVEKAARMRDRGGRLVRVAGSQQDNITEDLVSYVDPSLFEILSFDILAGDPVQGLTAPYTVAISQSIQEKYFPEQNAIGQNLLIGDETEYQVVAVYADMPERSHMRRDLMFSMETIDEAKNNAWLSHNFTTYLLLKPGADPATVGAKFPEMVDRYVNPQVQQFVGSSLEETAASGNYIRYFIQPLSEVYLYSGDIQTFGTFQSGDITYIYIFSAVALFLLLIACINFMNLSTARSAGRAREVGVRKALGSQRGHLISQFLIESLLVTLVAFALGLLMADLALPAFNQLAGKSLSIPWTAWWFIPLMLAMIAVIGLMAGLYPAFFLSGFHPVQVLKGSLSRGVNSGRLRSALVVFQFATSIVLIVSTTVVYRQLNYVQNKKIGFNKDQVLILEGVYSMGDQKARTYKQTLRNLPQVEQASLTSFLPVSGSSRNNNAFWPEGNRNQSTSVIVHNWTVDHDFVQTMGMEMVAGRNFSLDHPTDSNATIINEEAARQWGFDDPIGQRISTFTAMPEEGKEVPTRSFTVIGVVKDFHFESLKAKVSPLGLFIGNSTGNLALRLRSEDVGGVLAQAESTWNEFAPTQPFAYSFLDERFAAMYKQEQRIGSIFAVFAGLAIFIACLGLFALASFMAEQRTKEISIRKVLGAT
jgi:putative ABC transport system permease protein